MINIGKDTRLTDALERELMARAIEEQLRFKPGQALKALFKRITGKIGGSRPSVAGAPTHATN